jgi:hypothetical protein
MGQWSHGGMIMIGDMFNQGLKFRVDALCNDLARLLDREPSFDTQSQSQSGGETSLFVPGSRSSSQWWPAELGQPASTGAQNDLRYAFFPGARRLAIQQGGVVRVYDSGEHRLSGFSQQQGADQSLTFTTQFGVVRVADLPVVSPEARPIETRSPAPSRPAASPTEAVVTPAAATQSNAPSATADVLKAIEGIAELRNKNILTEEEYAAKKAELLSRL